MRIRRSSFCCALMTLACSSDFDPPSRLSKLRMLTVQADPSYPHPGETVNLSTLVFDPSNRPLSWGWATCTNPAAASVMGCVAEMDEGSFTIGTTERRLQIPSNAKAGLGAMVGVIVVACPGSLRLGRGPMPFRCNDGQRDLDISEFEVGMKRLLVRAQDRNENPRVDAVLFDGAAWPETLIPDVDTCAADKAVDCPGAHEIRVSASRAEQGIDELGSQFSEQIVVQYYASGGLFEWDVRTAERPETRWVARPQNAGSTLEMFFVTRDDRGGSSWTRRKVRVR